jgi:hypothetical protein
MVWNKPEGAAEQIVEELSSSCFWYDGLRRLGIGLAIVAAFQTANL